MGNVLLFLLLSLFLEGVFAEEVTVKSGDSVTFYTDPNIQEGNVIDWRFGPQSDLIARIKRKAKTSKVYEDVLDWKFKDRLRMDNQTGDLTIKNIMTADSGDYEVSNENGVKKSFKVSVVSDDSVKTVSVVKGDYITLLTGLPDMKRISAIQWRFKHHNSTIAEMKTGNIFIYDDTDERFKDKLLLNYTTGSLTIANIGTEHDGDYEVDIISSSGYTLHQSYNVTVIVPTGDFKSLIIEEEGASVTLQTGTKIQVNDLMQWRFEDTDLTPGGNLKDGLNMDMKTGSLTIINPRRTDSGFYDLKIIRSRYSIHKKFAVAVYGAPGSPICGPSGWSSGAVAGICAFLVAAIVALVIYFYRRIANLQAQLYDKKDTLMSTMSTLSDKNE